MQPARDTIRWARRRESSPGAAGSRQQPYVLAQRTQRHGRRAQLLARRPRAHPVERGLGRKAVELGNSPIDQVKDCQALNPRDGRRTLGFCASCVTD